MTDFDALNSPTLISRKDTSDRKIAYFSHCGKVHFTFRSLYLIIIRKSIPFLIYRHGLGKYYPQQCGSRFRHFRTSRTCHCHCRTNVHVRTQRSALGQYIGKRVPRKSPRFLQWLPTVWGGDHGSESHYHWLFFKVGISSGSSSISIWAGNDLIKVILDDDDVGKDDTSQINFKQNVVRICIMLSFDECLFSFLSQPYDLRKGRLEYLQKLGRGRGTVSIWRWLPIRSIPVSHKKVKSNRQIFFNFVVQVLIQNFLLVSQCGKLIIFPSLIFFKTRY